MNIRIVKLIKLNVLFIYSFWFSFIQVRRVSPLEIKNSSIRIFKNQLKFINKHRDVFINNKHNATVEFDTTRPLITTYIYNLAFIIWLCEKMKIPHVEFKFPGKDVLFEKCPNNDKTPTTIRQKISWHIFTRPIGRFYIPSEIGYTIFSKLPVRQELKEEADDWLNRHIRGDWIAVHYRGTDIAKGKNDIFKLRYRMEPDSYISYLKGVLDSRCRIFVCSDQAQFIDMMEEAFPGRVFSRDIQRSDGDDALHLHPRYHGRQQKRDAMIDMLILAKAELIYTTGSTFVDVIRFFNPKTKIVSLNRSHRLNHIPIPRKDLYDSLCIKR